MSHFRGRIWAVAAIALLAAIPAAALTIPRVTASERPITWLSAPSMDFTKSGSFMIDIVGTGIHIASWAYQRSPYYEGYTGGNSVGTDHTSIGAGNLSDIVYDGAFMYGIDTTFGIVIYAINTSYDVSGLPDPSTIFVRKGQLAATGLTLLCKDGNYLYATNATSLLVVSVSNKTAPVLVGTRAGAFTAVAGCGNVAYVIEGAVIKAFSATSSALPLLGTHTLAGPAGGLKVLDGGGIIAAGGAGTVEIVDIAGGASAMSRKSYFTEGGSAMMHEYQDVLFACDGGKIKLIDIRETSSPRVAGTYEETYSEPPYFYPYGDITRIWGFDDLLIYEKGDDVFIRSTKEAMAIVEKSRATDVFNTIWASASVFLVVLPLLLMAGDIAHKKKQLKVKE